MQIFCRRDQKEKLSEIKLPLKIDDCWYEFAIKKSPDELHTLVGDPELMGEYEDVSDTGIICNDLSTKTLFILYFWFLMADNFTMKKLCKTFVKNFKPWMCNFWVKSNTACNIFSLFIFFLVRQLEEQRADEYINIMTGNWWPETD